MMAWPANPRCPVACLEKYLAKRKPQCDALWQKPKNHNASSFYSIDEVWFCKLTHGETQAGESPYGHVQKSHASDKSIESYSARPTIEQQFESSAIVSRFIAQRNSVQPSLAAVSRGATSSFSATSSTAIQRVNLQRESF